MNKTDLDKQRQEIIEEIKRVFPVTAPFSGVLTNADSHRAAVDRLMPMFDGKNWLEVASHRSAVYNLSEVDHLRAITDEAYTYYLPALLLAMLKTEQTDILTMELVRERIQKTSPMLSLDQLQVLIACVDYEKSERQFFCDVFETDATFYLDDYNEMLEYLRALLA